MLLFLSVITITVIIDIVTNIVYHVYEFKINKYIITVHLLSSSNNNCPA